MVNSISSSSDVFNKLQFGRSKNDAERVLPSSENPDDQKLANGIIISFGQSAKEDITYSLSSVAQKNSNVLSQSQLPPQSKADFAAVDKYWEEKLDTDGSGVISQKEVEAFKERHPGSSLPAESKNQIEQSFESPDNQEGVVSLNFTERNDRPQPIELEAPQALLSAEA